MEMLRFIFAAIFLLGGVLTMISAVLGYFRFKYVLNRMHTAATADTFGVMLSMIGLIIWRALLRRDKLLPTRVLEVEWLNTHISPLARLHISSSWVLWHFSWL